MSLYKEWNELIEGQTDETFEAFWTKYAGTEQKIYKDLLAKKQNKVEGTFAELCASYEAEPVIFMGFLDGIQTSLKKSRNLEKVKEDSKLKLEIVWETLYLNMWKAKADYLYSLDEWNGILSPERQKEDSKIKLDIEWETLYFNMWKAKADYLYSLDEWDGILSAERRKEIEREYKKSLQAHAEKKPGRNDPCPCGSGKKYKNCCGKNN